VTVEYNAGIQKWLSQVEADLKAVARQSAYTLAFDVVTSTPVDTGFLRGSWQPSIGDIPPAKADVSLDPGGALAMADFAVQVETLELGSTIYYTNACVYARRIEYGFVGMDSLGRNYNQAGRFYVTNNVKRWPAIVEATAKGLAA
jgi:hypothetical protein